MTTPREVFLRGLWQGIIPRTDDVSWVSRIADLPASGGPLGDYGTVVRRMLDAGVSVVDVARLAQIIGYETAFGLCYHLDDPYASYEGVPEDGEEQIAWSLFLVDPESGEIGPALAGLHESILSMDPSGREMRPPST